MHGTSIVATWNEEGEVGIYNVASAVEELDAIKEETMKIQDGGELSAS